jgi:hypothetical protein
VERFNARRDSMAKITDQKNGQLNNDDRLEIARLLIKAGYTVKIGKDKIPGKNRNIYFIEYKGDEGK